MNGHRRVMERLERAFRIGATASDLRDDLRERCYYASDLSGEHCDHANDIIRRMDRVCAVVGPGSARTQLVPLRSILKEGICLEAFDTYEGISPCEYAVHLYRGMFTDPVATVITMIDPDGKLGGIHLSRNTELFNVAFLPDEECDQKDCGSDPFRLFGHHGFSGKTVDLGQYPLKELTDSCEKFMHNLDWNRISEEARSNFVSYFDVSSSIELFPHLQLDEDHELFCYISYQYHGLWGRVAAIRKDADHAPIITEECGLLYGPRFELPDGAVPPMEALYNDGTPCGYFEAILAKQFYSGLPYVCFERKNWDHCIAAQPKDLKQNWRVLVDIPDFTPRLHFSDDGYVTISAFWREFENGVGSSDGKDCIYLRRHSLESSLNFYLLRERLSGKPGGMYKSHIEDNKRYCKARRCCVSTETSIQIAVERHPGCD